MNQTPRHPFPAKLAFPLLLAFILALGAFLRYTHLSQPLLDFHPTRQLFSAVKARGMADQTLPNTPAWQKDLSYRQWQGEAIIEPPIVENLAACFYARFGQVNTAYPRAISATFWLIAAFFLFLLAKNLTGSRPAAAAALAFFLLIPYSVTASRSFQPDPLMVLFILLAWWAIENWSRSLPRERWGWVVIAGLSGGLAIFIKLPAVFFIAGGALGAVLARDSILRAIKNPQVWLIAVLYILPPALWLYDGLYANHFLAGQFSDRFYPELWVSASFYLRWFLKASLVTDAPWLFLALAGWLVFATRPARTFLTGLWISYLAFGFTFAHHISSHDYYSLPLIPIAALSLAVLTAEIFPLIRQKLRGYTLPLAYALLIFTLAAVSVEQYVARSANDLTAQAALYAQAGDAIGHQPGVVAITAEDAYPLAYYGWQNADPWPALVDIKNLNDAWNRWAANKSYFLITDFDEFNRQPQLKQRLYNTYPILAQTREYIVFDLLHPLR